MCLGLAGGREAEPSARQELVRQLREQEPLGLSWGLWDGLCSFWHPGVLSALSAALAAAFSGLLCLPCPGCIPVSVPSASLATDLSPCPNDDLWGPSPPLSWFPQFLKVGRAQLCVSSVMLGSA